MELRGRLLVEELVELNVLKLRSTFCDLCFVLCNAGAAGERYLGMACESLAKLEASSLVKDNRPVVNLDATVFFLLPSGSLEVSRLGEGDLEELSHDFLANVAKDSDTILVLLSLADLGIEGTGGTPFGIVLPISLGRSGEPFTRCIHDFGRATRDFLLPTLSSLGRSSLDNGLVGVSFFSFGNPDSVVASPGPSADTNLCISFSSRAGRQLKLAARSRGSSCCVEGV